MKRRTRILRVAAALSSFLMLGAYVAYNVRAAPAESPQNLPPLTEDELYIMAGSKSGKMFHMGRNPPKIPPGPGAVDAGAVAPNAAPAASASDR